MARFSVAGLFARHKVANLREIPVVNLQTAAAHRPAVDKRLAFEMKISQRTNMTTSGFKLGHRQFF
ncbi:MAG: hypothetical protein WCC64_03400 [Aliidongia sp.]